VPELVGRRHELAVIERFFESHCDGPGVLVIEGEAGIGKTLLWQAGLLVACDRGFRVLPARAAGSEVRLAFAALGDLIGETAGELMLRLPGPQKRALEAALLLADADTVPDPRAVGVAVVGVLRACAAQTPLLLAVDDLQWLDVSTGRILEFALRRLRGQSIRLLATVRISPGSRVPFDLDRSVGDGRFHRLRLDPLSLGALYEVVRTRLDLRFPRGALTRLHELSGGNPLFALEIGREIKRRGSDLASQRLPAPDDLRVLLRGRLAHLPSRTRRLLLCAAASPKARIAFLEAAMASPEEAAEEIERAVDAGVVEIDGDLVRFTHPLLASVCYDEASPTQRRRIHVLLAGIDADPEARARHLALAVGGPHAGAARNLDDAAGLAAGRGAPHAAAELWEFAARLTPPDRNEEFRRRRLAAADSRHQAGDLTGARTLLEEMLAEPGTRTERADLLLRLARTRDDDLSASEALCRKALEEADGDNEVAARVHRYLGLICQNRGDLGASLHHAREALAFARCVGAASVVAATLAQVAAVEIVTGDVTPGLLEEAVRLERGAGWIDGYASPGATLSLWLACQGRLDEARETLEVRLARAEEEGDEIARTNLLHFLTELECRAGNWARADRLAESCQELYEQRGLELQGSIGLFCRALVDAHVGRADESRRMAEQGAHLAERAGDEASRMQNLRVLGLLELSLGDASAAAGFLRDLPDRFVAAGGREPTVVFPVWPDTIEALIMVGELDQARDHLERYEGLARRFASPWGTATAARCRGLLAGAEGDFHGARNEFRRALEAHERTQAPFDLGRTFLAFGWLERRAKQKRAAREALHSALDIFEGLGASLWATRARGELDRVGGRTQAGLSLTPAERRVAELVAAGRRNREVANALFVTENTVEFHLRGIYRKLGIRSRAELAHRFAELMKPDAEETVN
jgi:DNA-binding CsgD family transcriptional regulator